MIVKEMKSYYENRYEGTHWVDATHGLDLDEIEKYRGYINDVKMISKELKEYDSLFHNIENSTPRGLREKISDYAELNEKYRRALSGVAHLAEIFNRSDWNTPNFIESYAVPVSVLLDAWEQFYHEVYSPGVIEHNKTKSGMDLYFGLPEGDYGGPKFYNSVLSSGDRRYVLMTDNTHNDIILGIDIDWKWRDGGVDLSKLYYKPFKTEKEIFNKLIEIEKGFFKKELKGASVDLEPHEIDQTIAHLDKEPINYYHMEAEDNQTTTEHIISDYVDQFTNWDRGFNMSHGNSDSFAYYYIEYKKIISQFKV